MIDFLKLWIEDEWQIDTIKGLPFLSFTQRHDVITGEVEDYPQECEWNCFSFNLFSPTRLQVKGSLHKFWNGGDNSNDFDFVSIKETIDRLCASLKLNPDLARIINLECGFNVAPTLPANQIIDEVIVYRNSTPYSPYKGREGYFSYIEFASGERYLKIYDKGAQYQKSNTLRVELKFMRSRELTPMGVRVLTDLKNKQVLQVLGMRTLQEFKSVVFDDTTINTRKLEKKERLLYNLLSNPKKWVRKTVKTCTQYRQEKKFVALVNKYGKHRHSENISELIRNKINSLLITENCKDSQSKYNKGSLQNVCCITCNKPLHPEQKKGSRFCSSRFVGVKAAHKCRNGNSNPRNNLKNKISKLKSKGLLFDIVPYLSKQE